MSCGPDWSPARCRDLATALHEAGTEPGAATRVATLVVAALTGLVLDLLVSDDRPRTEAGLAALCDLVDAAPSPT